LEKSTEVSPDLYNFVGAILFLNISLLIFNMLPIYPLDGGQILRSLLWFVLGRARSLMVASIIGFIGAAGFISVALWIFRYDFGSRSGYNSMMIVLLSGFMLMSCLVGLRHARALKRLEGLPRRDGSVTSRLRGSAMLCFSQSREPAIVRCWASDIRMRSGRSTWAN
jgi:hypothetical protein